MKCDFGIPKHENERQRSFAITRNTPYYQVNIFTQVTGAFAGSREKAV